ncbi:hypothetical protein J1N35_005480 [Gossypium stocksii]|uniref:hAT-like transposase RNase-H fold domain-containing protein n=1 Tax=Gossypium stocksii TaxID=47602 RepID=A0A9D3WFD5_9ROSI|nr:hypothetical protein J1N35_005480 [Gossypium stocksii]
MIVIVDNATLNDIAMSFLKKKYNLTVVVEGKYLHMRCITHIINVIVNDGLNEMNDLVARVRGAVKYIRQCPSRLAKFKERVKDAHIESKSFLCLDVSTRSNSTYLMLEQAQKFERSFEAFDSVDLYYKGELLMGDGVSN